MPTQAEIVAAMENEMAATARWYFQWQRWLALIVGVIIGAFGIKIWDWL